MKTVLCRILCPLLLVLAARAYAAPTGFPVQMIQGSANSSQLAVLAGNTRPEASAGNDRGAVPDALPIQHMLLQMKRSDEREGALTTMVEELHDPQSSNYHQWITPEQFAQHFGVAEQ